MKLQILFIAIASLIPQWGFAHGEQHNKKTQQVINVQQELWGVSGIKNDVGRTISIAMGDNMKFNPDKINIKLGETIRFEIKNNGKLMHEMVIGTKSVLDKHAEQMLKHPNMEHDEPYMAHVPPGKMSEIIWKFNRAGTFDFACLIAGHYQAGMVGKIEVQ